LEERERLTAALAGRYTIERELGAGGMATVYLADDLKHHRKVALKVLRPEVAAALGHERFLREIQITAGLNHPHILPLYDSGEAGGFLFYVMPHVTGESLRQRLTRESQLPVEEALRITRHAGAALEYAHARGVIHRDIKPENILIHEGEAMVADFGIALAVTEAGTRLTEMGLSVGTPEYMSPEQSSGERELDARSDVYSLGSVLYEMLTGEPPYTGHNARVVMAKRFTNPVPVARTLRPGIPPGVEHALARALALAPADRFASAAAFVGALENPLEGRPVLPSVAVLPFLNLSADPENEFFADGITEDVIAQLSKIRALKVISRTSVMRFKKREQSLREIGAKLEAGTVVEGSVRRAGDRVRIVAQLVDAANDRHLWVGTYDRQLTDIFAIQSDVALRIAAALAAELSPDEKARIGKEPTSDLVAYQLYLQGRSCYIRFTQEGITKGIEYFEQAIARDPGYALAYATIASANIELGLGAGTSALRPDEAYRRARVAVARALELDSGLAEAHLALGFLKYVCDFDWVGAEREFQRALELNPNSADTYDVYGRMLSALERHDEALAMTQRAQQLDPMAHRQDLSSVLLRMQRYEEAVQTSRRGVEFLPNDPRGRSTLGWALIRSGKAEAGVAELERSVALAPGSSFYLAQLGQAYAETGRIADARAVLRQLQEMGKDHYVSPYHLAYIYTGLGEPDAALDWLERAYEDRAGGIYGIKASFLFMPLRNHPRFAALVKKMNLA
jgi:serine/threonine-protein kinase